MLFYKTSLGKFKKIYQVYFPTTMLGDEKSTKRKILQKKHKHVEAKKQKHITEEIKEEIFFFKYLETNENTTIQNLGDAARQF